MSRKVIIVESPNKAKTIRQLLGAGYEVVATVGHFRDLPEKELGVDLNRQFEPTYVFSSDKKDVVAKLQRLKGSCSPADIFVASDADREGEAIGWHIAETIGLPANRVQRLEFHEITREGLQRAFAQVRPLDMDLVNAQQARRILDRLVGYKLSPIVRDRLPEEKQLSAGRVQSVALMVVVDREQAIRAFKPTESWTVHAHYAPEAKDPGFEAEYVGPLGNGKTPRKQAIPSREDAEAIALALRQVDHVVHQVKGKETKRQPPAPLITSTMLQQAASQLKMGTDETTRHAKALFEAGLVTYIRTDEPSVSPEFQQETLGFLRDRYGAELVPARPNVYKAKSASAQGAHECIRPTRLGETPGDAIDARAQQLYQLITRVYLASQCRPALYDSTEAWIHAGPHALKATGRTLKQKGYLTILDDRDSKETVLPVLRAGQGLSLARVEPKQHWSKPPDRFTEATLIKYLEEKGIGRPSTFASMVSLILRKEFVAKTDRKYLAPTPRGEKLDAELRSHFAPVINEGFTAQLEADLDRIASAEEPWKHFIARFWGGFSPLLAAAHQGGTGRARPSGKPSGKSPGRTSGKSSGNAKASPAASKADVQAMFDNPPCSLCGALTRRVRSPKNDREYFCCSRGREACGFIMEVEALNNPPCPLCQAPTSQYGQGTYLCVKRNREHPTKGCAGKVERKEELASNPKCYRCEAPMRLVASRKAYVCTQEGCNSWLDQGAEKNPKCPLCGAPTRKFPSGKGYGCVRWRKEAPDSCRGIVEKAP